MYNPNYLNWGQQGWVCSKCGKSFAPHISECPYCNAERRTFATTSTDKTTVIPFDDKGWWDDYQRRTTGDAEALEQTWKQFTTSVATLNTENESENNIITCPQKCEICDKYEKSCFGGIETTSNKAIISHRKPLVEKLCGTKRDTLDFILNNY